MATNHFLSIPFRTLHDINDGGVDLVSGSSSTAADYIELRWMTDTVGDGNHPTNVTKRDLITAFRAFQKWIVEDKSQPFPAS